MDSRLWGEKIDFIPPGGVADFEGLGASYTIATADGPQSSPLVRPLHSAWLVRQVGFQPGRRKGRKKSQTTTYKMYKTL